jgi:hypothetical protein
MGDLSAPQSSIRESHSLLQQRECSLALKYPLHPGPTEDKTYRPDPSHPQDCSGGTNRSVFKDVMGHQDKHILYEDLNHPSQLNVQVDLEAKCYLRYLLQMDEDGDLEDAPDLIL